MFWTREPDTLERFPMLYILVNIGCEADVELARKMARHCKASIGHLLIDAYLAKLEFDTSEEAQREMKFSARGATLNKYVREVEDFHGASVF